MKIERLSTSNDFTLFGRHITTQGRWNQETLDVHFYTHFEDLSRVKASLKSSPLQPYYEFPATFSLHFSYLLQVVGHFSSKTV